MEEKNKTVVLTEEENKVIEIMREIKYGEVRVVINNSKPIRVEEVKKSIQL